MYILEIQDALFAIKSLKSPTRNFDINRYITFTQGHTRSSTHTGADLEFIKGGGGGGGLTQGTNLLGRGSEAHFPACFACWN